MPWFRPLIDHVSLRRSKFDLRPVHEGFMVEKVALVEVLPAVVRTSLANYHSPLMYTDSVIYLLPTLCGFVEGVVIR